MKPLKPARSLERVHSMPWALKVRLSEMVNPTRVRQLQSENSTEFCRKMRENNSF